MKTKCGLVACDRDADVLVHASIIHHVKKIPRCLGHLCKNDDYEAIDGHKLPAMSKSKHALHQERVRAEARAAKKARQLKAVK